MLSRSTTTTLGLVAHSYFYILFCLWLGVYFNIARRDSLESLYRVGSGVNVYDCEKRGTTEVIVAIKPPLSQG